MDYRAFDEIMLDAEVWAEALLLEFEMLMQGDRANYATRTTGELQEEEEELHGQEEGYLG